MLKNLISVYVLLNGVQCVLTENADSSDTKIMSTFLYQTIDGLRGADDSKSSMVVGAKKVIEFSVQLVLKHHRRSALDAYDLIQTVLSVMQSGFEQTNDDLLVNFFVTAKLVDDVQNILKRPDYKVSEVTTAIVADEDFLNQVIKALQFGVEAFDEDNWEDFINQ